MKKWSLFDIFHTGIFVAVPTFIFACILFSVIAFFQTHTTQGVVNRIDYQTSYDGRHTIVMVLFEDGRLERFYILPTQTYVGDIGKNMKYTINGVGYIMKVEHAN